MRNAIGKKVRMQERARAGSMRCLGMVAGAISTSCASQSLPPGTAMFGYPKLGEDQIWHLVLHLQQLAR